MPIGDGEALPRLAGADGGARYEGRPEPPPSLERDSRASLPPVSLVETARGDEEGSLLWKNPVCRPVSAGSDPKLERGGAYVLGALGRDQLALGAAERAPPPIPSSGVHQNAAAATATTATIVPAVQTAMRVLERLGCGASPPRLETAGLLAGASADGGRATAAGDERLVGDGLTSFAGAETAVSGLDGWAVGEPSSRAGACVVASCRVMRA